MKKYQAGGLSQALEEPAEEERIDPATGYLGLLASQFQTSPEAQERSREILDMVMADDAFANEDQILEQMRETAETSRAALREARARILGQSYDPRQKWLAAAAAFGQPTRTGAFGETVGNVAGALQKPLAEERTFNRGRDDQILSLDQALAQIDQGLLGQELGLAKGRRQTMSGLAEEALKTLGKAASASRRPTPQNAGTKSLDQKMATELVAWETQGHADAVKSLSELDDAISRLRKSDNLSGPWVGLIPKMARDVILPESGDVQDLIETTAQRSLKAVLGGQFGQREGEMLLARTYNPRLPEWMNVKRAHRLMKMIEIAAEQKNRALEYFKANQTMVGYDGNFEWTIEDFLPPEDSDTFINVRLEDGRVVEVPDNWNAERIRQEFSEEEVEEVAPQQFAGGGKVKSLGKLFGIWDRKANQFVGKPYKDKKRARSRVDKLDNEYGAYRYMVKPMPEDKTPPKFAEGGIVDISELEDNDTIDIENIQSGEEGFSPADLAMLIGGAGAGAGAGIGLAELNSRLEELQQGIDRGTPAEQRVAQAMETSGRNPMDVTADVKRGRRMRVPELPLDKGGRMTRILGEQALMAGGADTEDALSGLESRHEGSRGRVTEQINRGLKPGNFLETEEKLRDRLYSNAKPLYAQAYKENAAIKAPPVLFEILESPDGKKAVKMAVRLMRNEGKTIGKADVTGMVTKPSLEFLDNLKRGFDQLIRTEENMGPTTLGRSMRGLRSKLMNFLDNNTTEAYKKARQQFKGDLEILEALDTGRKDYIRMSPDEARALVKEMSPGEVDSLRIGVAQRLYDDINRATSDKNAPQHLLGSPDMAERLKPLFHNAREYRIFIAALERERDLFQEGKKTNRRAESGRSRRMEQDFLSVDDPMEMMKEKVGRGPLAAVMRFLPTFGRGRKKLKLSESEADDIVRILTTADISELDKLGKKLSQIQDRTRVRRGRKGKAAAVGTAIGAALGAIGLLDDDEEEDE